jgi:hypothetical protein
MRPEQQQLAECRAHWEATKPDAVFPDYWLGWKAARESLLIELPKVIGSLMYSSDVYEAIEAAGVKVKS